MRVLAVTLLVVACAVLMVQARPQGKPGGMRPGKPLRPRPGQCGFRRTIPCMIVSVANDTLLENRTEICPGRCLGGPLVLGIEGEETEVYFCTPEEDEDDNSGSGDEDGSGDEGDEEEKECEPDYSRVLWNACAIDKPTSNGESKRIRLRPCESECTAGPVTYTKTMEMAGVEIDVDLTAYFCSRPAIDNLWLRAFTFPRGRPGRPGRPGKPGKPGRPGRPGKPGKPERPEGGKPQRPEGGKPQRPEGGKPQRPEGGKSQTRPAAGGRRGGRSQ